MMKRDRGWRRLMLAIAAAASIVAAGMPARAQSREVPPPAPPNLDLYFVAECGADTIDAVGEVMRKRFLDVRIYAPDEVLVFRTGDTLQLRLIGNERTVPELVALAGMHGLLRVYVTTDSVYGAHADSAHPLEGCLVLRDLAGSWRNVSPRILNAKLDGTTLPIERFDQPTLYAAVSPRRSEMKHLNVKRGTRLVVAVDDVIYASTLVTKDSLDLKQLPIARGLATAAAYILQRAVERPLPAAVRYIGYRNVPLALLQPGTAPPRKR